MSKIVTATKDEVQQIAAPEPTPTWNPVSHAAVLNSVDQALSSLGIGIRHQRFEVAKNGDNFFGTYRLDHEIDGKFLEIGFRNSTSKKFAVGITAGTFTLVCSNLVFTGNYIEFRKHTAGLTLDEMQLVANRAISKNVEAAKSFVTWQQGLHEIDLGCGMSRVIPGKNFRSDFESLIFAAMATGAVPPSKFGKLLDAYKEERRRNGDTLYTFHATLTNALNESSRQNIAGRSKRINDLTEFYERHGIAPAASFYDQLSQVDETTELAETSSNLPAIIEV